ncbi:mannose-6-phosphate isomerase, class I [Arthrobacter sp. StoSoilB13]|uniref:mannose-6-phosphate isomerase, class I n=1 Tax=Arthrobacter sp. StoSoilB13 TaxID=2830993 RepID=UPI001CC4DB18|nr:mannose-6-phosphate isomerase, class I [Arthrobacter sp. StoSoilB13]BCW48169.1 mannose-6-phosphate isomerase, class I [Arthrobacter sp. StoSoilB13]
MHRLKNTIRNYKWGSTTLMADYLGHEKSGQPEAEMWLGAHPGAASIALSDDHDSRLDELILGNPQLLGEASRQSFGDQLPFLMKVLAAESALSLQVHPTRNQAAHGFAEEDARGIPRDAPHRNFKDSNHKPEMIVALTDFEALCGFRSVSEAASIFSFLAAESSSCESSSVPLFGELHRTLTLNGRSDTAAIEAAFGQLLTGGPAVTEAVNSLAELLDHDQPAHHPFGDALSTARELSRLYPGDPGVLISLMLNHVALKPGDAIFLPAGNIHAYLHGLGIEVMASSDNVLRGGLTGKHVDIPELMRTVDFTPLPVPCLNSSMTEPGRRVWEPPFNEFQLQQIELDADNRHIELPPGSPAIVLVVDGQGTVASTSQSLHLHRGQSAFIGATEHGVTLQTNETVTAFVTTLATNVNATTTSQPSHR